MEASYIPGGWVAVAGPGSWLLVNLPPESDLVQRCWPLLANGAPVEDVLDVLVSRGLRSMPDFALVRLDGADRRALARGAARIVVKDKSGDEVTISGGARAWTDVEVADEAWLLLLAGDAAEVAGPSLPMAAGVTMARSIRVDLHPAAEPVAAAPVRDEEPLAADERQAADELPAAEETPTPEESPAASYDFLFGATQRPDELPTLTPPAPELQIEQPAVPDAPWGATAGWHTLTPPADELPLPLPPEPSGGLIDALPWETPVASPPPDVIDEPPVDVSRTIDRSALRAAAAAIEAEPPLSGPTVLAGRCPNGHLSPPHAPVCRACRAPMPPQDAFEIARPTLGVLRLSTGDVVTLDRGVVFGRAPEPPANVPERPHVVRLASPENDISRTHAEIVIDGWHVYVRDLGSTNGTVVTLPGQPPQRVRPHDLQLLEAGSTVSLADEVSCTFEVTP